VLSLLGDDVPARTRGRENSLKIAPNTRKADPRNVPPGFHGSFSGDLNDDPVEIEDDVILETC